MILSTGYSIAVIAVIAICTFITRVIPFLLFGGNREVPTVVTYLGKVLPPAVMAALVIYCLKSVSFLAHPNGIPELIAIAVVALLHLWKHNSILSIGAGTICYMFLIQVIFV